VAEKKLRDFAPEASFAKLTTDEKIAALHRGFVVLLLRYRRQSGELAIVRKQLEEVLHARRKKPAGI
jgi:hypothetical protein